MRGHNQIRRLFLGLLLLALPASAQIKVGDDVSLGMNGDIGFGYSADYGNTLPSDHGLGANGDANINGYFYNPNFLNFYVRTVYDRSQENSGNQSLTEATSVVAGAGIFSGSHFPGTVSFDKNFNSTGNFGLPGVQGFTTSGDATQFGIGWSELVPGLPPVGIQYFQNSSSSTIFGSDQEDHSSTRNFNVQSNYRLAGFTMAARFGDLWTHTELPAFLTGAEDTTSAENSKTFSFNATHSLPLRGTLAFGYGYGSFTGEGDGSSSSGSNQTFSGNATFAPWSRLTTTFGAQYDTNLQGLVEQQLVGAGSVAPEVNFGTHDTSLSLYNYDILNIAKGLSASFNFIRTQQEVYGQSAAVNHFAVVVTYHAEKPLWGAFNFYVGANDQSSDAGHQGTGLVAGVNFNKKMRGFDLSGGFAYAQDVQTVVAIVDTSEYSYLANVRRELSRHLRWNANFNGYHSGLSYVAGTSAHSEGFGTNLMYRGYGGGVTYNTSYGTALLTASGLVPTPVTVTGVLGGNQYLLANGKSYSVTASATPINRWTTNVNYSKAQYDTTTPTLFSSSSSKVFTVFTECQFRKISFVGGYTHLMQGVGAGTAGALPADFSSFYIGIQRWFKPF